MSESPPQSNGVKPIRSMPSRKVEAAAVNAAATTAVPITATAAVPASVFPFVPNTAPTAVPIAVSTEIDTRKGLNESEYAANKKKLMAVVNEIRSTGVALDVDIPGIVVAGNQSSGKSSVIEAISGVTLPRAMGTCTKVPIEVRLRRETTKAWQAVVKIRWEVNEQGEKFEAGTPEVIFGPTLMEPRLVEKTVRRAQLAVLNPSVAYERFLTYDPPAQDTDYPLGSTQKQLAFSRNMIVLEISGPDVADLTLTDLPGIIQNVGKDGDRNDIKLVEDLVRDHIAKDCLILLVITMKDDIRNQKAVALAQDADPDGQRTIGVLTKADTLHGSEIEEWMKVLRGESEPLRHGYYVTRQPNADELAEGISFEEARKRETDFFDKTPAWAMLDHKLKQRLGTGNLTSSLSDQLLNFIHEKLPGVINTINERYQAILAELDGLGDAPSGNHQQEMTALISHFTAELEAWTDGRSEHEKLIQDVKVKYGDFRRHIWATKPRFLAWTRQEANERGSISRASLAIKDLDEEPEEPIGITNTKVKILNLDDVRDHVKKAITRELENNVPFAAKVSLLRRYMSTWSDHAANLVNGVVPLLEDMLEKLVSSIFGRYKEGMLPAAVRGCIATIVAGLRTSLNGVIAKVMSQEDRPYTMNDHYLKSVELKVYTQLSSARNGPLPEWPIASNANDFAKTLAKSARAEKMNELLACLNAFGWHGYTEETLVAKLPRQTGDVDWETELRVMAQTRAYWQVAYKRIIDVIPRWIDSELIIPLSKTINDALLRDLEVFGSDGPARCAGYLAESPSVTRLRDDLEQRRARLERAKQAIKKFGAV